MSYTHYRASSPGDKRFVDPLRASTGNIPLGSSAESYYHTPRSPYEAYPSYRASGDRIPDVSYRANVAPKLPPRPKDTALEALPISSQTYRGSGNGTKSRTEYAIRPRSNTASMADPARHTTTSLAIPPSPSRLSPIVTSGHDRPRSPVTSSERYLVPATPHRHRRVSSTGANDRSAVALNEPRLDRRIYQHLGDPRRSYPVAPSHPRYDDVGDRDAYSYTNAREQFDRDSAARARSRQEDHERRERPLSMTGLENYLPPLPARKEPRELGPPPTSRGLDKLERSERHRHSSRNQSGHERSASREGDRRRWSSQQYPVALHQDWDDGYSSYREGYDSPREKHRHRHTARDERRHGHSHVDSDRRSGNEALSALTGGLATAGLVSGYSKDPRDHDYEYDDREGRRTRDRGYDRTRSRSRAVQSSSSDEDRHRKGQSRRHRSDSETDSDGRRRRDDHARRYPRPSDVDGRREHRTRESDNSDSDSRRERHRTSRILPDEPVVETPTEAPEDRQKRVQVVDLAPKESEPQPKGILKQPTQKFPEEKNAVREGVAPLKDATKKGIPPGARWTKIDRRLVNPAALEAGKERFEERTDYVIVLRVLTKEEIQSYAVKTQEIREARYESEHRRRREDDDDHRGRRRRHRDGEDSSEDEEDRRPALAIEGPPEAEAKR